MNLLKALVLAVFAALSSLSAAQISPSVGIDLRSFGNDERLTYVGISAADTINRQFKLQLAGVFSDTTRFMTAAGSIDHGGTDVELLGTYMPPRIPGEISLGFASPHTSDRGVAPALTYRADYRFLECHKGSVSLDSYGIAEPSPLVILGLAGAYKCDKIQFNLSLGTPVDGQNSVSVSSDARNRVGLFSAGVDWKSGNNSVGISITNQLGWTTGMMATPALGGYAGIEASWKVRF